MLFLLTALLCLSDAAVSADNAHSAARRAPRTADTTDRIVVKWRDQGISALQIETLSGRTQRLRDSSGLPLRGVRSLGRRLDVMRLPAAIGEQPMRETLARLRLDPAIEYVEADERRYILAAPNDPRFVAGSDGTGQWQGQWYLASPTAAAPAAIDAVTAWNTTRGGSIIVAVIDTGVQLDHPDLSGKLLAGRDFVCNDNANISCTAAGATLFLTANDGDGWDSDASDPGDWISSDDLARSDNFFDGCGLGDHHDQPVPSSWHGTRVAGVIAAATDNGIGIAGAAPDVRIVPVRAIGKCTGYMSDLVAAMYWAGGISDSSISGVPSITQRAHIVNLSLGGRSACTQTEQDAVTRLIANGVLVVAAAGNDGGPVGTPANCSNVLSVAGLRHVGTKVGYSNVSSTVATLSIGAPAGNCVNVLASEPCLYSIETLSNEGDTTPTQSFYTYSLYNGGYTGNKLNVGNVGTSFAAPLVSAVAALMVNANGELTTAEVIDRIKASALPFPTPPAPPSAGVCHVAATTRDSQGEYTDVQDRDCQCTTATCGAGMLNAPAALEAALRPIAIFTSSKATATMGERIQLDGRDSLAAGGHYIASYQWSTSPGISISQPNSAQAEIVFPALRPITVYLTVTDEAGRSDTTSLEIQSSFGGGGGDGGGGSMGLAPLALALLWLARRVWRLQQKRGFSQFKGLHPSRRN